MLLQKKKEEWMLGKHKQNTATTDGQYRYIKISMLDHFLIHYLCMIINWKKLEFNLTGH